MPHLQSSYFVDIIPVDIERPLDVIVAGREIGREPCCGEPPLGPSACLSGLALLGNAFDGSVLPPAHVSSLYRHKFRPGDLNQRSSWVHHLPVYPWIFGGLCGLLPWRRRQPSGGAARVEAVFFRPRGRRSPRGVPAVRHGGWGARATRRNSHRNSHRSSRRNSVHKCPKTAPRGRFRRSVYTPASPRLSATAQQCTQMPQNSSERPFPPICVHSFAPTATLVTGRGHGPHDIDGPMAPVMPGRSDLRSTPPGR